MADGLLPAEMEAMEAFDGFPTALDLPRAPSSGPVAPFSRNSKNLRRPHQIPGPWPQDSGETRGAQRAGRHSGPEAPVGLLRGPAITMEPSPVPTAPHSAVSLDRSVGRLLASPCEPRSRPVRQSRLSLSFVLLVTRRAPRRGRLA